MNQQTGIKTTAQSIVRAHRCAEARRERMLNAPQRDNGRLSDPSLPSPNPKACRAPWYSAIDWSCVLTWDGFCLFVVLVVVIYLGYRVGEWIK